MENSDLDNTISDETNPVEEKRENLDESTDNNSRLPGAQTSGEPPRRKRGKWLLYTFMGALILLIIAAISAYSGYRSGIGLRQDAAATVANQQIQEQYELGLLEMEQGEYYRARQRFEYVIQLHPDYPGASENLAQVVSFLNTTATPTLVPTPTLTPTPDLRGVQELFDQGQQYLANSEWTKGIDSLLVLRKTDPDFRAVELDGMLFLALRNRGIDKIGKEADLEGGIYDLTLAERFGPLDTEAQGFLNWSKLYITGASFWEIDWGQAVYYFGQVAPHLPNLRDGSGWTATERYRISLVNYGDILANQKQWCKAMEHFQLALSMGYDAQVEQALNGVTKRCIGDQEEPTEEGQDP
jgi:tetratricopeptide (TPR) repeat protein